MRFVNITLKLGNMRKAQEFTLYPLTATDKKVCIQSSQRWAEIDIETGSGAINRIGKQYANSWLMRYDPLAIQLTPEQVAELKAAVQKMIGSTNADGSFTIAGGN